MTTKEQAALLRAAIRTLESLGGYVLFPQPNSAACYRLSLDGAVTWFIREIARQDWPGKKPAA